MPRLLSIGLLFLIFTSCSEEPKPSDEKLITRKWTFEEHITSEDLYAQFIIDKNGNHLFESNIPDLPEKGIWKLMGEQLSIIGAPTFTELSVDSVTIRNDSAHSAVLYYNDGRVVGTFRNNVLNPERAVLVMTVDQLDENTLVLNGPEQYTFYYEPDQVKTGFSLISILRGLLGLATLLLIAWLFSANRKAINWRLVSKGLILQITIALAILKLPVVGSIFDFIGRVFVKVIGFTQEGTKFLFANIDSGIIEEPLVNFAINVLPTVIFFSALTSLFYYWGILQKVVQMFAVVMKRLMSLSGAESMAAAGNIFIGQTEAPLLVKPYLMGMTKSEIMCLMTGGMATIAGGVLAAYIGFLGGGDPEQELYFAKHLLTASIMSAPAAIVAAKMIIPEEENFKKDFSIPKDKIGTNELEAIANGTTDGIKLAVNVAGMLLVFTALVALCNYILGFIGDVTMLNDSIANNTPYDKFSFDFILGYAGAPLVWLMGVSKDDMVLVGELLGKKTIINEFIAYPRLGEMKEAGLLSPKSVMMATYMLCGFANIASIGIQIGGIGALVPGRKGLLSQLGFKALIAGTIACLMTAVMVGMLM